MSEQPRLVDPDSGRDLAAEEWARLCGRDHDSLAVAEPEREITVGGLIARARARAGELIAQGVEPGSRVILARPNVIEFVVDYLAIRLCGAILINLPWNAGTAITELAEILDASCVIITEDLVGHDPLYDQLGERRFRPMESPPEGPDAPVVYRAADEHAWFACTSGTTGTPKAAMHTAATWYRQTEVFEEHFQLTQDDPIFVSSPVGHAVALLFGVSMALKTNAPMILIPRWRIETAADLVSRYKCAFTVAPTPFLMDAVTHAEEHGPEAWESLKFFPSAGAPVPRALIKRALTALPSCQVWSYFGTSEAGGITGVPIDSDIKTRIETEGKALPGMETRIVDGELELRGIQLMTGYWSGDPDGRMKPDGWYVTGDAATQREDGYIRMIGRARDIILRGGENISHLEVENALLGHKAVEDVAIIGYPDDRLGSRLAAVVVQTQDVTLEELRDFCSETGLAKAKWPEYLTTVDSIPLSNIGKVRRGDLEQLVIERRRHEGSN